MPRLADIIGITAMGKNLWDTMLYQRFLSGLAPLVMLTMLTGILVGMVAAGLFLAAYLQLVRHGLEAEIAFLTVGLGVVVAAIIAGLFTLEYIKKLRRALQPLPSLSSGVSDIANAFVKGLLEQPTPKQHD